MFAETEFKIIYFSENFVCCYIIVKEENGTDISSAILFSTYTNFIFPQSIK